MTDDGPKVTTEQVQTIVSAIMGIFLVKLRTMGYSSSDTTKITEALSGSIEDLLSLKETLSD